MTDRDPPGAEVRAQDDRPAGEVAKALDEYPADLHADPAEPQDEAADVQALAAAQWRVAKSLLRLREQVNAKFPGRSKASDGTIGDRAHCPGASDHCANINDGGVGVVTAMDITHDPAHDLDAGELAETIRTSQDSRVKYIISDRRIANFQPLDGAPAFGWRPYNGANPHTRHVHISVRAQKARYDSTADWEIE
jgi:hypothetical protein